MPLFEYRCPEGHITERLSNYRQRPDFMTCRCGLQARYRISAPKLDYLHIGVDAAYQTASDRWERMHKEKLEQERKRV